MSSAVDRAHGRAPVPNRRERARAAMLEEIKQNALELMRDQGTPDVRFSDIARAMGVTAPALYRYYANRDELLTDLIVDSFDDLTAHLSRALASLPAEDVAGRLSAAATAYRAWASAEPLRFTLIFGQPVPDYAAPVEGPTTEAAKRAMGVLAELVASADRRGDLAEPLIDEVGPAFAAATATKFADAPYAIAPATHQAMLHLWAAMHGFTCLEAYGHLNWLDGPARDALFRSQIKLSAITAGLPVD